LVELVVQLLVIEWLWVQALLRMNLTFFLLILFFSVNMTG